MTNELTTEQKQVLDDMVARRIENTGETREAAVVHITNFFLQRFNTYMLD
jgi:hypothetical protein